MQFKNKKNRKYLRKIYLWIALGMLLPLILFASIAFINVQKSMLDNEYQANKKILYEVKFNINFMDDMIVNTILSMSYNSEISSLLYNDSIDFPQMLNEINKLKTQVIGTNPFIHSIYLYNGHTKTYYTTFEDLQFKDAGFESLLQSKKVLPKMKPLPRKLEFNINRDQKRYENVITYFMYDYQNASNQPEGAVVVNASTEWLLNNIKDINMVDDHRDKMIILDNKGDVIGNKSEDDKLQIAVRDVYLKHSGNAAAKEDTGFFTDHIDGKKYLITYTYVDKMNWTLVKAQLYDEVFSKVNTLKYTLIVIILALMLLVYVASILISKKIYKPIDRLVQNVASNEVEVEQNHEVHDEISYLNQAYRASIDQINAFKLKRHTDRDILKTYFLRQLLVDSRSITSEEFCKASSETGMCLSQLNPGLVCIVKIDNRMQFEQMFSHSDRDLYTYGIINISEELLAKHGPVEVVEMKNDHLAFILNADERRKDEMLHEIKAVWEEVQTHIKKFYKLSISVYISDLFMDFNELTDKYDTALNNSVYRLLYGKGCILTNRSIEANTSNPHIGYSAPLEKKLVEALKSGNEDALEDTLRKIVNEIALLSYNNVLISIMGLVNTLKQVADELNRLRLEPLPINFNLLSQQLFNMETLEEQYERIAQVCMSMISKMDRTDTDKNAIISNTIIELIQADYANPAICLQYIAEKMNVSAKQVSKIFNGQYGRSVSDYINDIRLEKAAEWFENSNRSIKEVLQKIGMENESYFYRLFKKKYGVTPKEYIFKKHLLASQQGEESL